MATIHCLEVIKQPQTVTVTFISCHHSSLALWFYGKGNIGYGANIGSNHTGRLPDQECIPGEGVFFGLGCNIKYPCNFEKAPYSLIASGITLLPQVCSHSLFYAFVDGLFICRKWKCHFR